AGLLSLGAMGQDGRPRHPEPDRRHVFGGARPPHLLEEDEVVRKGRVVAPVLARPREPDEPGRVESGGPLTKEREPLRTLEPLCSRLIPMRRSVRGEPLAKPRAERRLV